MDEATNIIKVLDKGFIELIDHMGSDLTVANAARVSFGKQKSEMSEDDKKLIHYLASNKHMSPFRHVQLQFRLKAPEFVMRQWYKHVVGINYNERCVDHAWNEISGRYAEYQKDGYYIPAKWRKQSADNKQATTNEGIDSDFLAHANYCSAMETAFASYYRLLELGVGREQARMVLPLSIYTEVIWTASLEAVANFIRLRDHEHAQWEIREYAKAIRELSKQVAPVALEALGV
jgi:thymidylate synthase (FAD)